MNTLKSTLVLDIGSGQTKAGLADNGNPSCIIPTSGDYGNSETCDFKGDNNVSVSPVQWGIIKDYDRVEDLLRHIYEAQLVLRSEEHPVLITQPPKNPQRDRNKIAELFFEKFQVPALYEEMHSVLTFYSSGRPAGLIVESGHGVTTIVPIISGFAISDAILRVNIGGSDIERYLSKILNEKKSININTEESRLLKEKLCFVPNHRDYRDTLTTEYLLPDGRTVTLAEERYSATRPLFEPVLVEQFDTPGIHDMIFQSIFKCGVDLRKDFANNIILSGGNSLFSGLDVRLKSELKSKVPATMNINIIVDPDRQILVWKGGAILGSLSTFTKNICVSIQEYQEFGESAIRNKFLCGL
ncbi:actin, muscle-like [Euwallacea similis]|uniref:actin, muscle-like n=1 Tax=Euwallacea similis TaxID=1736056 RepID=UPI00344C0D76